MAMMKAGPAAYRDVRDMLDLAFERGGAIFNCGSQAAAIKILQRMNNYRIIHRKISYNKIKANPPTDPNDAAGWFKYNSLTEDMYGLTSKYDDLIIRRPING